MTRTKIALVLGLLVSTVVVVVFYRVGGIEDAVAAAPYPVRTSHGGVGRLLSVGGARSENDAGDDEHDDNRDEPTKMKPPAASEEARQVVGSQSTLLLGIFTTLDGGGSDGVGHDGDGARRRQLIRETYLRESTDGVCSLREHNRRAAAAAAAGAVGGGIDLVPGEDGGDGRRCSVVYTFVVGGLRHYDGDGDGGGPPAEHVDDSTPLAIDCASANVQDDKDDPSTPWRRCRCPHDHDAGDITYLNIRENMNDGKTQTWFKYAASKPSPSGMSPFHYVAKIDSDTFLNANRLVQFVRTNLPPPPYNVRMYGGRMWPNLDSDVASLYMAGQFYFVSHDLATYVGRDLSPKQRDAIRAAGGQGNIGGGGDDGRGNIATALATTTRFEDVDFGAYVWSNPRPIKLVDLTYDKFWHHPVKSDQEWNDLVQKYGPGGPRGRKMKKVLNYPNLIKEMSKTDSPDMMS